MSGQRRQPSSGRRTAPPHNDPYPESYRENLLQSLKEPDEAAQYLNACLEDDDARVFLMALRDVADSMSQGAE